MDGLTVAGLAGFAAIGVVWQWAAARHRRKLAERLVISAREAERRARENCRPLANVTYLGNGQSHDR